MARNSNMALPYKYTGTLRRSAGIYSALAKQSKLLNLKTVKKIQFAFDPFGENVLSLRNILFYFYLERVRMTNPKCILKTNVLCDRTEPSMSLELESGRSILFMTQNLSPLDILKKYNEIISSQIPPEEPVSGTGKTKGQKRN